jgi:hypothetical protein
MLLHHGAENSPPFRFLIAVFEEIRRVVANAAFIRGTLTEYSRLLVKRLPCTKNYPVASNRIYHGLLHDFTKTLPWQLIEPTLQCEAIIAAGFDTCVLFLHTDSSEN